MAADYRAEGAGPANRSDLTDAAASQVFSVVAVTPGNHNSSMLAATYDQFESVLKSARALPVAAEAHGTLAGALCSSRDYGLMEWLREILPDDSPDEQALQSSVLQSVYSEMVRTLVGSDADFEPLLPDDDASLGVRAEALSSWCAGFLYGLGSGTTPDPGNVSVEAREIIRDFTEITQVGVDADEENEENEAAFAEVVEFVRVGVQLLFVELAPARGEEPEPGAASIH
jgi:uncharacterized protein YgfB (UPF0149 family)